MYLKEIRAHGFKSFADKTVLNFINGINGIVGPNGSGKSNVVDAVRWVLGEQSVKSLRGEGAMTDVIFSGSKSRNSMNVASVALVFDNQDKYFPLDYNEVEIKRRVYKDGTNEYFLNGEKVRLKDITNILLDSGIAKESLNIISQGKIESIINSKPSDRRAIFEEAAGVLKYKRRKEEALRNLDKTHDNKNRVNDIIKELEDRLGPLKEAKEKAIEYEEVKNNLENIEIALITEDITNLNYDYQTSKSKIDLLNKEILSLASASSLSSAKSLEFKTQINELDNQIKVMQARVLELTTLAERLNSQKNIINERQKYATSDIKLHENIVNLKEQEMSLKNKINSQNIDNNNLTKEVLSLNEQIEIEENNLKRIKNEKQELEKKLSKYIIEKRNIESQINNLKDKIDNGGALPLAVRSVLNNPKLRGIKDVLGNIFETDEKYNLAISTALGYNANNIITEDEEAAKEAINYLKNVGRATFFPLTVIKPKLLDENVLNIIKNCTGFVGIASELVKYDKVYQNIILNQLGNIIITDNLDNAIKISNKINRRYRLVTLDGDVINVGGSMTGGKQNKPQNLIADKYELENKLHSSRQILNEIKELENQINEIDYKLKSNEDKVYLLNKDKLLKSDELLIGNNKLKELNETLEKITLDINSTNNILEGKLSKEEEEVIEKYYAALKTKDEAIKELDNLNKERKNLNETLEEYEINIRKGNKAYSEKNEELKNLEIKVNRLDVRLDNLLNNLTENYNMTYDKAKENYKLEIDYQKATSLVSGYKKKIKELGVVNLGAKEEYEEVKNRYEFLNGQINDLNKAENTLLEIIDEMDKVMETEFITTFNQINECFSDTFKELFKGGKASLKLTEPDNLLETGIEIVASPPGKKLSTITLLSGGEKTLTAISLLFAIIKTKSAPFCILDEVEAALDEANVDTFGKYVTNLKNKSQFIIITHKKTTMEYADILYGITMQESGVSKLVSVKLEEIND